MDYIWDCDEDSYRLVEEDGTAWISCDQTDRDTKTRPSPSSKRQRKDEHIYVMQTKNPQWKILPQDYLHHLCGQSLSGMTQLTAIPQQYSPPHRRGLAWRGRSLWWLSAMRDETPSNLETLHPSNGLSRIPSLKTGSGSQTQMQQFAGGNASAAGDQTWGCSTSLARYPLPT